MIQKLGKVLLVLLVMVPLHVQGKKSCETLCNLIVSRCLRVLNNEVVDGNLTVGGTFTLDGVSFNNLTPLATALGVPGATPSLGTLVSSIIPFSSGNGVGGVILNLATAGLPTTGFVMGFGSDALLTGPLVDPALTATYSSFAFTVPQAGTLYNLWGTVDANYLVTGSGTFPFVYTIYHSSVVNGTPTPYTATTLTATATLTPPATTPGLRSAFGNSATSLAVAAGDRIVLVVTPTTAIPATTQLGLAGFNAGVLYSPAN